MPDEVDFAAGDKIRAKREIGEKVPIGTPGEVVRIRDVQESVFPYEVVFDGHPFYSKQSEWPVMGYEIERV